MLANNARLLFKLTHQVEPEITTFLGSFPEDDPEIHIFEFEINNEDTPEDSIHSYIVIQEQNGQLLTREVTDSAEISAIMAQSAGDCNEDDEATDFA